MEKFKISDIQEIFVSDVERFHSLTQQHVTQLLNEATPSQEALDEALRQCHTLKGLAGTVEAWGLSSLGADLERLLEMAGSWVHNERARANEVFEFILDHMQDWYVMNQFTCMEMLPQAWDVYQGLRGIMAERWPGYLPEPGGAESVDAQYVRLSELEISEVEVRAAQANVAEAPASPHEITGAEGLSELSANISRGEAAHDGASGAELKENLDVRGAHLVEGSGLRVDSRNQQPSTISHQPLGAPLPVRVVPPTLRHRDAAQSGCKPRSDDAPGGNAEGVLRGKLDAAETQPAAFNLQPGTPAEPALPQPLQVVPPVLRRREAAEVPGATAQAESVSAVPAAENVAPVDPATVTPVAQTELSPTAALPPSGCKVPVESCKLDAAETQPATSNQQPATPAVKVDATASAAAGTTTPPLLRVAPPALKRRGKKSDRATAAAHESADAATSATPIEPLPMGGCKVPVESCKLDPAQSEPATFNLQPATADAEAIFAALPESVEPSGGKVPVESCKLDAAATEPAPREILSGASPGSSAAVISRGETFNLQPATPDADRDLLELLSQEVAGYLTELTASLAALAGNLAAPEPWERARRLFHTIKGTAATFGLDTVSAPAKAAEARCMVAVEDATARTREAFETSVHRAGVVAKSLHLAFAEAPLRMALETGLADAANAAVASAQAAPVAALDAEMAGFFINDTRDQIAIIEQAVLRWERLPAGQAERAAEQVQAAQRGFHTIKGAGNSIGLTAVAQSVHEVEAFLESVASALAVKNEKGKIKNAGSGSGHFEFLIDNFEFKRGVFTFLLGAVDQLRRYLVALAKNTASPWRHDWSGTIGLLVRAAQANVAEPVGAAPANEANVVAAALWVDGDGEEDAQTLRIETARLYQLMNLISEMVIDRARLARKIEQLAGLHRALAERNGALTGSVLNFQQQFEFNVAAGAAAELTEASQGQGSPAHLRTCSPAGGNVGSRESGKVGGWESGTPHSEFSALEFDRYDQFNVLARSLVEISHDIEVLNGEVAACLDSFTAENAQFTQTSQELQSQVTGLGLVPVNTLFPRLQRAFRDACSVAGKEADLVLSGGEVLLDKVVVDKVYAPLLHLLRNAVAHGIEEGKVRAQRKKAVRGMVRLTAGQLSNQIVLVLTDDGGGVDGAAVRERAIAKGWLEQGAPELTPEQVAEFIFRPGFRTAKQVTSVSGRGIGLDVVRKEVEHLNGSVELKYAAHDAGSESGCTWTLRLPLTLAISEAILAVVGGAQFAFPLNFVEAGLILESELRKTENGVECYPVERRNVEVASENGELETGNSEPGTEEGPKFDLLPVWRLSRLFGIAGDEHSNKGMLVGVGDRRAIVVVDVVMRRQEVVVKQLDVVMAGHPLLNGASLDAEGRVIPILNLPTLLKFGEQWARGASRGAGVRLAEVKRVEQTRVLVVDDSLSVRKVQERFLRDLGCQVTVASDGLVALERLRELEFDLIFTDLEMPRLNGYELISELRGNPAWSHVPVVVISSRGADKYITKAMNLGASTFLSKPFTQEQLKQVLGHYAKG